MESERKSEDAAHKGNNKSLIKSSWGLEKSWGPRANIPCSPLFLVGQHHCTCYFDQIIALGKVSTFICLSIISDLELLMFYSENSSHFQQATKPIFLDWKIRFIPLQNKALYHTMHDVKDRHNYLDNEKHWSAKTSAQQCMWLYLCVDKK